MAAASPRKRPAEGRSGRAGLPAGERPSSSPRARAPPGRDAASGGTAPAFIAVPDDAAGTADGASTGAGPSGRRGGGPADGSGAQAGARRIEEPVWLVRIVLLLFFVAFAAFLAREVRWAIDTFP